MRKFFKKHFFSLIIALIVGLLFLTDYRPGTFLSGWDNLQTELYPWLAVKRAFWGVWQEYQSFGLTAGMGHAADLVRAVFLWIVSFVLPSSVIRYFFHFLMVLIGGWGMFRLLKLTGFEEEKEKLAFLGALFYLLNFGTLQIMFLPFESFSVFLGFLPWEIWIFLKIIDDQKREKKDWWLFFLINFLATPQGVSQQLFLVYLLILGLIAFSVFLKKIGWLTVKRLIAPIFMVLAINSFWLLPQLYFLKTSGSVVKEAKINQLATEDLFYSNLEKGNLKDFFLMQGFFYDRLDKNNQPLFAAWKTYRESLPISILIYFLGLVVVLGVFSKSRYRREFLLIYFLVGLALLGNTFPVSLLNRILRGSFLINQIFRTPFTKFVVPYCLVASYFFTCGLDLILNLVRKTKPERSGSNWVLVALVGTSLFLNALPSFRGYFISPEMKVKIPQEYFDLIEYFKSKDRNKRIALLPEYTFWGWFFHRWGYDGSGFLWYGIEQPIISRTFDVWSLKSESYFWEMKAALESEEVDKVENVLRKYRIDYLLVDYSLLPVASSVEGMQADRIENLLGRSQKILLVKKWSNLALYQVRTDSVGSNFVSLGESLPNIGPAIKLTPEDTAFQENGDYQVSEKEPFDLYYPYLDLSSQTKIANKKWQLAEKENNFLLTSELNFDPSNYRLSDQRLSREVLVLENEKVQTKTQTVDFGIEDGEVKSLFDKVLLGGISPKEATIRDCSLPSKLLTGEEIDGSLKVTSRNGEDACFGYSFPVLSQKEGYLFKIESQNVSGRRLFFYLLDSTKKQSYLEERLPSGTEYYLVAPHYQYGIGYDLNFRNNSYQRITSSNQLNNLEVYLLPYEEMKKLKLTRIGAQPSRSTFREDFEVKKKGYYFYRVEAREIPSQSNLILWQAFEPGWVAWKDKIFFGKKLNHVLINNWANGWELENSKLEKPEDFKIYILFWPQVLEYLGFALLFLSPLVIWKRH